MFIFSSFVELIGYTDRFVWGRNSLAWEKALAHHYNNNKHHPQHWGKEGNMPTADLQESVIGNHKTGNMKGPPKKSKKKPKKTRVVFSWEPAL